MACIVSLQAYYLGTPDTTYVKSMIASSLSLKEDSLEYCFAILIKYWISRSRFFLVRKGILPIIYGTIFPLFTDSLNMQLFIVFRSARLLSIRRVNCLARCQEFLLSQASSKLILLSQIVLTSVVRLQGAYSKKLF